MTKNVGNIERMARIALGAGLCIWGYVASNWWGAIGVIPLFTGLTGWCPPYSLLGISTCKVNKG